MKQRILATAAMLCLAAAAHAAKLDLNADVSVKAVSYTHLNYASADPTNRFFYLQNASLGFIVKNIQLQKTSESTMDVGIVLHGLGVAGSTVALNAPLDQAAARYPNSTMVPFMENAYIRVDKIFERDAVLIAGRQPFVLASGLTLSDDGLGFTGFRMRFNSVWRDLTAQVFTFQPQAQEPAAGGSVNVVGASLEIPAEGLWQIYNFWELDKRTTQVSNTPVNSSRRQFAGFSYSLKYGDLTFESEAAIQRGKAKGAANNPSVTYEGSAFFFKGQWHQDLGKLGEGYARAGFGRGSGDKASSPNVNEAFFPSFGHRYNGLERSGYGELYGASLYDAMGGDSTTITGLPPGLSGIQVFNMGVTMPPYKKIFLDIDYYTYEANTSSVYNRQLGHEWDWKLTYPVGDQFRLKFVYATFTPGAAYPTNAATAKKVSLEASARF